MEIYSVQETGVQLKVLVLKSLSVFTLTFDKPLENCLLKRFKVKLVNSNVTLLFLDLVQTAKTLSAEERRKWPKIWFCFMKKDDYSANCK